MIYLSIAICLKFFIRNGTFKKWLALYEALVLIVWAGVYILVLLGIRSTSNYQYILRPVAPALLLIPGFEKVVDWWRHGHR